HKDKSLMKPSDFVLLDSQGNPKSSGKPSGETAYHLCVYNYLEDAKGVIHTHSVYGTLISELYDKQITFKDYEFLKGINILNSLSEGIEIPIFSNLQDISENCELISSYLESYQTVGFLLKKHGLFVWGNSWEQCKQHCEILEFLFQVTYMAKSKLN
ncbi:MAG: methylthioribulose 1-phosphate dehydratase, partial [Crocosphaera sp.]